MIDAHLHLWDPARLDYDWLRHVPAIAGRHGLEEWAATESGVRQAVFVQADCAPAQALAAVDWPVVDLAGGYARWRAVFEAATAALPSHDRRRIESGTATAFYALAPETLP